MTLPASWQFFLPALTVLACTRGDGPDAGAGPSADGPPPWDVAQPDQQPRPGMVWIPPGVLIAGTPPDVLPRVADEEMAGEQVVMRGFYIDVFSQPNEAGAIPTTGMTRGDARAMCEGQSKRLCTELELERACKGPDNTTYEYGDTYRASICETGTARLLVPNGVNARCVSGFGVHDLHGGPWTWTSSTWGRGGDKPHHVVLRGGNSPAGERIGRCANARPVKPDAALKEVGVRCCGGEPNSFEVVLQVVRGDPLRFAHPDDKARKLLEGALPEDVVAGAEGRAEDAFVVERTWTWHPIGNEELVLGGGCGRAGEMRRAACGIVVVRVRSETATRLAFVSTDRWQPTVGEHDLARVLFVYGGDEMGAYRKKVTYDWGRVLEGPKERKRRIKGKKGYYYEY